MNLPSAIILACLLLGTAVQQTKGETDWNKMVDMMTGNWKTSYRQFVNLPDALEAKGYPMDELKTYVEQALPVAEKAFDERMTKYDKYPQLKSDVKQIFEDYIPNLGEAGSNEDLVDNVVAAIREYIEDPKEIVTCMGDILGTVNAFKKEFIRLANENEKKGEATEDKFIKFQMGDCIEIVNGQNLNGFKGPCSTDKDAKPLEKCQPVCEETFEKHKEA